MLIRPRRNRKNPMIRALIQENHLNIHDIIAPFFLIEGDDKIEPIKSLPGISRYTLDKLIVEVASIHSRGIQSIAIFPALERNKRSKEASEAFNENGLIPSAIKLLKKHFPNLTVITDIALDPYTDHGHDGLTSDEGEILNDETIKVLVKQALVAAKAGVDAVAPSDMMDGRIKAIRSALDSHGYENTTIIAYTAKYASALYGPFRDAIKTKLAFGDKLTYQLNPANIKEALLETKLDQEEGADMLLVKPATFYLDVIAKMAQISHIPIGAYHVSGEYAMVQAAASQGMLDLHKTYHEALLSIKRAGGSFIFTYAYKEMLEFLGH
ncbi:MAG: porphobilinogen synthase [Rhabdochlamydiaceae bacterium]|nr:porphobilinogen synthase [Candidatus Amphrikana amoebophyrae]